MTSLRAQLLRWFNRARRDLPWRRTSDPYAIWVSEVMLQQTQVDTVIPYWTAFLGRFPNVRALAKAPLEEVLHAWKGLGYYRRARLLHAAAHAVVEKHDGALPQTAAGLRELPGFGRYTAGAVASLAFGEQSPVVDGNVARVLSRLFEVEGRPGEPAREQTLWALAENLVVGPRPGDLNQALMELGALVCTPARPDCAHCPVRRSCRALASNRVEALPRPRVRKPPRPETRYAVFARQGAKVLVARRSAHGLYGGLWELPSVARLPFPTGVKVGARTVSVTRQLTHRTMTYDVHTATIVGKALVWADYDQVAWVDGVKLTSIPMSAAAVAVLKAAQGARENTPAPHARKPAPAPRRPRAASRDRKPGSGTGTKAAP